MARIKKKRANESKSFWILYFSLRISVCNVIHFLSNILLNVWYLMEFIIIKSKHKKKTVQIQSPTMEWAIYAILHTYTFFNSLTDWVSEWVSEWNGGSLCLCVSWSKQTIIFHSFRAIVWKTSIHNAPAANHIYKYIAVAEYMLLYDVGIIKWISRKIQKLFIDFRWKFIDVATVKC